MNYKKEKKVYQFLPISPFAYPTSSLAFVGGYTFLGFTLFDNYSWLFFKD